MDLFTKEFEIGGEKFVFKQPSAKQMIAIDRKALELREGLSDGLTTAHIYSQSIALLNTICIEPQGIDFGDYANTFIDELSEKVVGWLNSFRS